MHILHVKKGSNTVNEDFLEQEGNLKATYSYPKLSTNIVHNDSIINGINDYISQVNADLVAMFTHKTSLFHKFFDKSLTKEAAFQAKTPLLTFQKEK